MPMSVSTSQGPPADAWTMMNDYDGSGNLIYTGMARSFQERAVSLTVVSVSKAAAAVITITGHGLQSGNTVDIAGGTGDWAGINGNQLITVTGADTFTIAVNTSAYSGSFAGTVATNSPQTNAAIWSIQRGYYTGTTLDRMTWAGGNTSPRNSWAGRTTLKYL